MAKKKAFDNVDGLPKWFDNKEGLGDNRNFDIADRPLYENRIDGGSYQEVKKYIKNGEVHHIPSQSCLEKIDPNDGPAIRMDTEDHRKTASWGSSREAFKYRDEQRRLISENRFKDALNMDINDIQSKFDSKYDSGIEQARKYAHQKGYL